MKKIASVLLAVLVAFSMFSFAVSAASVNFTVTADKTTVKAGDKVNVKISIPENAGLATLQVVIKYDKEAFKVTNAKAGGLYGFEEVNPKTGFYASAASTAPTKGGVLYTVELEALKATDSKISLVVNEATDNDFNEVKVSFNEVSIKGYVEAPSEKPSETPSEKPSETPSEKPSETPSEKPSETPSEKPSEPEDPCKDGHDYSKPVVVKAPTCKDAGVSQKTCKRCGDKVEEAIPATGKCEPGAWKVVKPATTTAQGEKVQECKYCGKVLQRAKIAKLPSDPITNPAIPNTDAQA